MKRLRITCRRISVIAVLLTASLAVTAGTSQSVGWRSPIAPPYGAVVGEFDAPVRPWSSGHRGIDLAAPPGTEVRAAAAGVVSFAGTIAGRGVVVVRHGALRSTYEPVEPVVPPGTRVQAGDTIATLATAGSHCAPLTCLHWGVRDGPHYHNPQSYLASTTSTLASVRLLPLANRALTGDQPSRSAPPRTRGGLSWPVANPFVTSPYGMRTHPITGEHKLHDGTDLRAPCGTAIRAAAAGRVTHAGWNGPYGLQVAIDHQSAGEGVSATSYGHLSRLAVMEGRSVRAGQVIGWSGTTGRSTGCHLHFMAYVGGSVTDPMRYLPR